MPARVLFIGLDSAEATLLERWVTEAKFDALAELYENGATYHLDNCWDSLPTSVWPELTSGRSAGKLALFFPPSQLHTGDAEPRRVVADEVDPSAFWTIASDAGQRVAVIDLPWTVPPGDLNGILVSEWGTHDRWFGTASYPRTLLAEIRERHGEYPVRVCDHDYGATRQERERLLTDLLAGIDHETSLLLELLEREDWDLFACAFGQFQCVGHNFWAYLDGPDDVPDALRRAIPDVYGKVDASIAALRAAAGADAVSVVVASHGMGPLVGGPRLLSEVLVRLGAGSGKGSVATFRSRLPTGVRSTIRRLVPGPLRRRLQKVAGSLPAPLVSEATRAVSLPADVNGYVRLNLRGREPYGCIEPGPEFAEELGNVRSAFLELEQPATGERIVSTIVSAEEAFGSDRHPDVPDLMVAFRTDLGALESCVSDRVGLVKVPAQVANRSGDHTGEARLWLAGPRIRPGGAGRAHALDVAPTILSLLDVPVPRDLDGSALV